MRILIGEDDVLIAVHIKQVLIKFGYTEIEIAHKKETIINKIDSFKPELCILDIRMEGEYDGIEIGEYILENYDIYIIYLTAHSDKDVVSKALKTKPSAYILKPYTATDIFTSIQIAIEKNNIKPKKSFITIRNGMSTIKLQIEDIAYLKAENPYVEIHTLDDRIIERISLDNLLEKINNSSNFIRIHRSYVVNVKNVSEFFLDKLIVKNTSIPVSRRNQYKIKDFLKNNPLYR